MSGFDIGLEFLPPNIFLPKDVVKFRNTVGDYTPVFPDVVSVTFHERAKSVNPLITTFHTIPEIREVLDSEGLSQTRVAAHITCKGVPIDQVEAITDDFWRRNIEDLVVLTGDLATGETMPAGYFSSSTPLIKALFEQKPFNISVAGHPRYRSDRDIDGLKKKLDAGATRIITQYDFETENYLRFEERVRASGIVVPIAHGVMPIGSFKLVVRLAREHKVPMHDDLIQRFTKCTGDRAAEMREAQAFFVEQLEVLRGGGVEAIHVYTLNLKSPAIDVLPHFQRRGLNGGALYIPGGANPEPMVA